MAKGIAHREWYVYRDDFETDADFRAAVENEQALNVHIQERLGVGVVSAPIRRRDEFGRWVSEAYVFQTASVPAARDTEPTGEVEALEEALAAPDDVALVEDPA